MRIVFFLLVLANLVFFAWGQGYFGEQTEGREPQRLRDQLQPEKMKVAALSPSSPAATPPAEACRRIEGFAAKDADAFQKTLQDAGLTVESKSAKEAPVFWVNIPSLTNKAMADRKVIELRQLGVTDIQVIQTDPAAGLAISLGIFATEAAATEFLAALNKKGVRSARVETKAKPPAPPRFEVHGDADLIAKRLPDLLAKATGAAAAECK
jgi:hypothetical protein